jgi:hypothetical protein
VIVIFHKANNNEWIWSVKADNNKVIGRASETYHNRQDAVDNFTQLTGRVVSENTDQAWLLSTLVEVESWEVKFDK